MKVPEPAVDPVRVHPVGPVTELNPRGRYVLYWTQIFRRPRHNHALNRAIDVANSLRLPVVVYEGLRHDYPWASDRIHVFILEGAVENAREYARRGIPHLFFLERSARERRKAVAHLGRHAALVVTDFFPCFIIPRHNESAARQLASLPAPVPLEAVDSCGVVPLACFEKEEYAARPLRPKLRNLLGVHLKRVNDPAPRYQEADPRLDFSWAVDLEAKSPLEWAHECNIDHSVHPVEWIHGGFRQTASTRRKVRMEDYLRRYGPEARD